MKAVGLYKHLPIEDLQSLVDLDIQQPNHPTGHDLLVAIKDIVVSNPDSFEAVSGHGLEARYVDHTILIGNTEE
jgi:cation transport ATPase